MRLFEKLALAYIAVVLLIALVGTLAARVSRNALRSSTQRISMLLAREIVDKLDRHIHSRIEQFRSYARLQQVRGAMEQSNKEYAARNNPEEHVAELDALWTSNAEDQPDLVRRILRTPISRQFREIANDLNESYETTVVAEFFATNKFGATIGSTGKTSDFQQNDEDWWQKARAEGLHIGRADYDESAGAYSLDISVRVDDQDGSFLGVFKAVLKLKETVRVVAESETSAVTLSDAFEGFVLLTADRRIIYSTRPAGVLEKAEDRYGPEAIPPGTDPLTGSFDREDPDQGELLCTFARSRGYRHFTGLGWILVLHQNAESLYAPLDRLTVRIWTIAVGIALVGLLAGLVVARSVSRRVSRLKEEAEAIGQGDFARRINPRSRDEIGQLGRAFDKMASNLEKVTASRDELDAEIQQRKKLEKRLAAILAELRESNEELEHFAYITSHDLQEPLRKITAFGQRLEKMCADRFEGKEREYLDRMVDAAGRMQNLINDLLTFSRVTTRAKPFEPVDLNEVAEDVVSDLGAQIDDVNGTVNVGELPEIQADPTQMHQLFQNLISNGLKFHREDTPPVLDVRGEVKENDEGEKLCRLTFSDNGIGFEENYLDRIFNIFQRLHTREEYKGTGIGLAVCQKIVKRHGGDITAESRPGEGSTFIVSLPIKPPEKQEGKSA